MSELKSNLIYGSSGHPHLDEHIMEELLRFCPNLLVTFSEYDIDKLTGKPRFNAMLNGPMERPRWHIWKECDDGVTRHLFEVDNGHGEYAPVDRRVIDKMKGDLISRGYSPEWIAQRMDDNQLELQKRREQAMQDYDEDFATSNAKLFSDALAGIKTMKSTRDPKIMSYKGQGNRGTATEQIPLTDKEFGLEKGDLPDISKVK